MKEKSLYSSNYSTIKVLDYLRNFKVKVNKKLIYHNRKK